MTELDWRSSPAGARIRAAMWLAAEVGEGNTFTKADLRAAFPAIEQVDRRMRDLRPEGWVIATYREDASLEPDELRLVRIGGRVWERGYKSRAKAALSDKHRNAVFAADGYACIVCGIAGGEAYGDDPLRKARLLAAQASDGGFRTYCERCHRGSGDDASDEQGLREELRALDNSEKTELLNWIRLGRRSRLDELWGRYRRLPTESRRALERLLEEALRG